MDDKDDKFELNANTNNKDKKVDLGINTNDNDDEVKLSGLSRAKNNNDNIS